MQRGGSRGGAPCLEHGGVRRGTVGVYDMTPRGASRDRGMAAAHYGRPPSGGGYIAAIGLPLDVLRWTRSALISTPKSPNQLPFSRAVKTCTDYHVWFTCEKKNQKTSSQKLHLGFFFRLRHATNGHGGDTTWTCDAGRCVGARRSAVRSPMSMSTRRFSIDVLTTSGADVLASVGS